MKMKNREAFTMIELIFVIVVIGILSAIAIPKFAATRDDAIITKGRAAVAALRSAIATERQKRILKGEFGAITGAEAEALIEYGLSDEWSLSTNTFTFTAPDGTTCAFDVNGSRLEKKTCGVAGMKDL